MANGKAGAPKGNNNAGKGRRWLSAIERALDKRSKRDQIEALDELAEQLLNKCAEGDLGALKELGDRLDGKAAQSLDITFEDITDATELTDQELASIAASSSTRTAKQARSKKKPDQLH